MGKNVKHHWLSRSRLVFLNTIFVLIPLAYLLHGVVLRYAADALFVTEQPEKSDAIVVLAGGEPGRAWEAADLYRDGFAPKVVLTSDAPSSDFIELRKLGIELPASNEAYSRVLHGMSVPNEDVLRIETYVEDTLSELRQIRIFAEQQQWNSLIIVTSNYHSRRSRLAARYVFGPDMRVAVVASRHGGINNNDWWNRNSEVRTFLIEFEKLIAYTLYIWPRMIFS